MSIASLTAPEDTATRSMPALMSACVLVVVAMVAAINLALPELGGSSLQPTSNELLWIVDAYILVFGCLLIPAGALGDRLGRKGVLLAGLAIFATGCVASAASPTVAALLVARVVTGIGAALVMPATLSLLLQVTEPADKPKAIATWAAATGAAGALGNLGGGLVLQWLPWQGLFLIMGPIALGLAAAVARIAPRGERHGATLDPAGATLLTGAVFGLLLAIIEGPAQGWTSSFVLGTFTTAGLLATAFVVHSLRTPNPIVDPRIFTIAELRNGTIGVAAVFFGLFALFFVNAQYLQYAKGYSPLITGLAILPLPLTVVGVSKRSVPLADRYGTRTVITSGMVVLATGLAAFSLLDSSTPYLPYVAVLLIVATGMGLAVPSLSTGIVTSLPPTRAGMGSGLNSAVREIGAALGIATVGTILTSQFNQHLPVGIASEDGSTSQLLRAAHDLGPKAHDQAVDSFTNAMASGFRVIAAVVLVAAIVTARRVPRSAASRDGDRRVENPTISPLNSPFAAATVEEQ
jgi:EmrB/QacA subfamily drug resistance transporter